jgi:hypothetical protein
MNDIYFTKLSLEILVLIDAIISLSTAHGRGGPAYGSKYLALYFHLAFAEAYVILLRALVS